MKKYSFTISETLEHISVNNKMSAYKLISKTFDKNDELITESECQGICYNKSIQNKREPGDVHQADIKKSYSSQPISIGKYAMFKPGLVEIMRNHSYGTDELNDSISKLYVDKPYDFANSGNEFEIFCYSGYDGNLYDIDCNILPRAILFVIGMNGFSEDYFSINDAINSVKNRDDIVLYKNRCGHIDSFTWIPNDLYWEGVKVFNDDSLSMNMYIMLNIFNIKAKDEKTTLRIKQIISYKQNGE